MTMKSTNKCKKHGDEVEGKCHERREEKHGRDEGERAPWHRLNSRRFGQAEINERISELSCWSVRCVKNVPSRLMQSVCNLITCFAVSISPCHVASGHQKGKRVLLKEGDCDGLAQGAKCDVGENQKPRGKMGGQEPRHFRDRPVV